MTLHTIQTTQLDIPPGMIHLGIGQPDPSLLPLALMKNAAEHRLSHDDVSLLAYGAESGDGYFRLALAQFLAEHYHKSVDADDLFVTAGASQGLDLICTLFTKPGETIFVEEPSYFLAPYSMSLNEWCVIGDQLGIKKNGPARMPTRF